MLLHVRMTDAPLIGQYRLIVESKQLVDVVHPISNAAITIHEIKADMKDVGMTAVVTELSKHVAATNSGDLTRAETMLMSQAQTLDVMFNEFGKRVGVNLKAGNRDICEQYLRMALKAQAQCRTTIETLAEVKNPRSATFVKQQNVANQQQINNGVPAPVSPAHGTEKTIVSNELIEGQQHGERMDTGAAPAAGGGDPQIQTVAEVDRAKDADRQGNQQSKRVAARSKVD